MAKKIPVFREETARTLARMAHRSEGMPGVSVRGQDSVGFGTYIYLLQPQADIDPVTPGATWTMTAVDCWVLRISEGSDFLEYQLDEDGGKVEVTAWNLLSFRIRGSTDDIEGTGEDVPQICIGIAESIFGDCIIIHTIPHNPILLGKNLGASIAANSSGTITVYKGTPGSEDAVSPSYEIEAFNRTSTAIAGNTVCSLVMLNGNWYATPWECPP